MSAQLVATSQPQTFYVKNSLHQASAIKASSYWEDGAGGKGGKGGKAGKYLLSHPSSRLWQNSALNLRAG